MSADNPPYSDFDHWFLQSYGVVPIVAISNQYSLSYIWFNFYRSDRKALLDNGARVCTVNLSLLSNSIRKQIQPTAVRLAAANGTRLHCSGVVFLNFTIGNFSFRHPFFVVRGLQFDTILGLDFFRRFRLDLMYSCNEIQGSYDGKKVTIAKICNDNNRNADRLHAIAPGRLSPPPTACSCKQTQPEGQACPGRQQASSAPAAERHQQPASASSSTEPPADSTADAVHPSSTDIHQSAALSSPTEEDIAWIQLVDFPADDPPSDQLPVYCKVQYTIPPHSKMFLPVSMPVVTFTSRFLHFSPNEKLRVHHVHLDECVVSRNQKVLPITNASPYPAHIETNMILGWLSTDCESLPHSADPLEICSIVCSDSAPQDQEKPVTAPADSTAPALADTAPSDFNFDINPALDPENRRLLELVLKKFRHCFVTEENEVNLLKDVPTSELQLTDSRFIRTPPYKLSPAELKFLTKQLQGLEEGGLISRSTSHYRNPIIVIRKSDGSFKAVWDFRKLNKILKDQPYDALPMESLLEKVHGYKYFAVLDLKLAYMQCPLDSSSRQYTAFQVPGVGTFEFNGIPIGTKTAPALFQYIMEYIFGPLREKFPVLTYFDDNLCCANSIKDLIHILHEFLSLVDKHGISLSAKKCSFGYSKVKFLGYDFENGEITLPDSRLEKIRQLQPPKDYKTVQSVNGVFNQLRRFVPNYGNIAAPIISLLAKRKDFSWTEEHQAAFDQIKTILLKNLPLHSFHPDYPTYLYTDASHQCAGAALFQKRPGESRQVPIDFFSRSWSKNERNWPIFHLEYASAAIALRHYRHLLLGKRFTLLTDSKPLTAYATMKPEGRLAKFCLILSQYDFEIKWIEGRKNVFADVLSRLCPTPEPRENFEVTADDIIMPVMALSASETQPQRLRVDHPTSHTSASSCLPSRRSRGTATASTLDPAPAPRYFTRSAAARGNQQPEDLQDAPARPDSSSPGRAAPQERAVQQAPSVTPGYTFEDLTSLLSPWSVSENGVVTSFPDYLRDMQLTDPDLYEIIKVLDSDTSPASTRSTRSYRLLKGVLFQGERIVAPKCIRYLLLTTAHDLAGHHGQPKTLRAILDRGFIWKTLHADVKSYCSTCELCQFTKHPSRPPQGFLRSIAAKHPFDCLAIDYCGPLPASGPRRFCHILLITDCFTHFTYAYKTTAASATKTIECLKHLFLQKGLCRRIIHDAATYFDASHVFKSFLSSNNIVQIPAPRYAHWVVGIVESRVCMIKALMARYCSKESDWSYYLDLCMFFVNSGHLESIGMSPYKAMHGVHPLWPADLQLMPPKEMTLSQLQDCLSLARRHVVSTWAKHRLWRKRRFDKGRQEPRYSPGQRIKVYKFLTRFGVKKICVHSCQGCLSPLQGCLPRQRQAPWTLEYFPSTRKAHGTLFLPTPFF